MSIEEDNYTRKAEAHWKDIEKYEDLSPDRQEVCDWLVKPAEEREIDTQKELAEKLDLSIDTVTRWKYKDEMKKIVKERRQDIVSMDNINEIINSLTKRATKVDDNAREANEATDLFFKWYYGEDFKKDGGVNINVNQAQKQSKDDIDPKDIDENALEDFIEASRNLKNE